MFDFQTSTPDFSATTISVSAVSAKAREFLGEMFGQGAVSVELPKSTAPDFAEFVSRKGFTIQ